MSAATIIVKNQSLKVIVKANEVKIAFLETNTVSGGGVGGGGTWGSITGTLSNQTDLQAALDAKAALNSPALTGTPIAPTAAVGTNTTQIANTAFVTAAVAANSSVGAKLYLFNNFI